MQTATTMPIIKDEALLLLELRRGGSAVEGSEMDGMGCEWAREEDGEVSREDDAGID